MQISSATKSGPIPSFELRNSETFSKREASWDLHLLSYSAVSHCDQTKGSREAADAEGQSSEPAGFTLCMWYNFLDLFMLHPAVDLLISAILRNVVVRCPFAAASSFWSSLQSSSVAADLSDLRKRFTCGDSRLFRRSAAFRLDFQAVWYLRHSWWMEFTSTNRVGSPDCKAALKEGSSSHVQVDG